MHHSVWACLDADSDLVLIIGFCNANIAAKPVDNLVDYSNISNKVNTLRSVGKHIRRSRGQFLVIDTVFIAGYITDRSSLLSEIFILVIRSSL